jgi:hypothetical protein
MPPCPPSHHGGSLRQFFLTLIIVKHAHWILLHIDTIKLWADREKNRKRMHSQLSIMPNDAISLGRLVLSEKTTRRLRKTTLMRFPVDGNGMICCAFDLRRATYSQYRYCENTKKEDPLQSLRDADRDDLMLFLEWILDNYRSRKRISIFQKFKHWRQLFRKYAPKAWPETWRYEVNNVCVRVYGIFTTLTDSK